jgi:hypothetical protein
MMILHVGDDGSRCFLFMSLLLILIPTAHHNAKKEERRDDANVIVHCIFYTDQRVTNKSFPSVERT